MVSTLTAWLVTYLLRNYPRRKSQIFIAFGKQMFIIDVSPGDTKMRMEVTFLSRFLGSDQGWP